MTQEQIKTKLVGTQFEGLPIHKFSESKIRPGIWIVIFMAGFQTNVTE